MSERVEFRLLARNIEASDDERRLLLFRRSFVTGTRAVLKYGYFATLQSRVVSGDGTATPWRDVPIVHDDGP